MLFAFTIDYQVRGMGAGPAGLQRMRFAFERLGQELKDAGRYVWPHVMTALEDFERRQFAGEGIGPNRGKWAPLTPGYAAQKEKRYPGQPILVRTGSLRAALTQSDAPFAIRRRAAGGMEFGAAVQYGHYHQLGTVRMVDRPLFDFDERFQRKVRAAALKGVRQAASVARLDDYMASVDDEARREDSD